MGEGGDGLLKAAQYTVAYREVDRPRKPCAFRVWNTVMEYN